MAREVSAPINEGGRTMRGLRISGILAVVACALLAAGCGDDDDSSTSTSTSSSASSAEQSVDSAVKSCTDQAKQIGGSAGTALEASCTSIGDTAKKALSSGSESAQKALSSAASSCKSAVGQLPQGDAQKALSSLCDALASAE